MTSAEAIKNVAKSVGATKKEVIEALMYWNVQEEIQNQIEYLRKEKNSGNR